MRRILYLDKKSNEIEKIIENKKNLIARAANIKKYPFKMIDEGDKVYFINNNAEAIVLASAIVKKAEFIELPDPEKRVEYLNSIKDKLKLRKEKYDYLLKRKYLSLFHLTDIKKEYSVLDRSLYGKVHDWVNIIEIK